MIRTHAWPIQGSDFAPRIWKSIPDDRTGGDLYEKGKKSILLIIRIKVLVKFQINLDTKVLFLFHILPILYTLVGGYAPKASEIARLLLVGAAPTETVKDSLSTFDHGLLQGLEPRALLWNHCRSLQSLLSKTKKV